MTIPIRWCEQNGYGGRPMFQDPGFCGDCKAPVNGHELLTEINPPGGYGRPQLLVCDVCMGSGRWDHWIKEHWPTWPRPPDDRV